jgi:hypothetical protein
MTALDWTKAQRRRARQRKKKRTRVIGVHPNSTAARVWGRSTWRTSE